MEAATSATCMSPDLPQTVHLETLVLLFVGAVLLYAITPMATYKRVQRQGYKTTNNMELLSVIVALEALKRPCQVELYSDSKLRS